MEEYHNPREVILKHFETVFIVALGMYLHLNQISIIELKYSKLPGLQPNNASAIFTFSVLSVLAVVRPYWPAVLKKPPRFLRLLLELALTLYLTDLILRQVWVPMLRALTYLCAFLSQYMVIVNRDLLYNKIPEISSWIRDEFFYMIRMTIAITAFCFMTEVTGFAEILKDLLKKIKGCDIEETGGRGVRKMESRSRQLMRHLSDNDNNTTAPPKPKKKRKSKSLTRRRPQIQFDHDPVDYYC